MVRENKYDGALWQFPKDIIAPNLALTNRVYEHNINSKIHHFGLVSVKIIYNEEIDIIMLTL